MGNPDHDLEGRRHRDTCRATCYAWASFLIWTIVIFLLIFGIAFFAFVRSNLPQVKVHRLDVYKLNITEPKNTDKNTNLSVDVEIMVNVTNNNKKITLVFRKMNVETMIEGHPLPRVRLDGFRQKPMTANDLKIRPKQISSSVNDDDDAKELKLVADRNEMVFSLKMKGKIEFWYKGRVMSKLNHKVSCEGIEQSKIDQALAHECNVKLVFLR